MRNYLVVFLIFTFSSLFSQVSNFSTKFDLPEEVSETSGLLFINNKIVTHNDSGGEAKLYEIDDTSGLITRTITISNATNVDWEDITEDDTHIYIGDIGNNNGTRTDLTIYKILKADYLNSDNVTAEIITYAYEDQIDFSSKPNNNNFDAEAISIYQGNIIIFTKNWEDLMTKAYVISKTSGDYTAVQTSSYNVNGLITGSTYNEENDSFMLVGYNNEDLTPFLVYIDRNRNPGNNVFNGVVEKTILTSDLGPGNQVEGIIHLDNLNYYISREKIIDTFFGILITIPQRLFEFTYVTATTWEGDDVTSPTDWAVSENWSNQIPTLSSNVILPNVTNKPIIAIGTTALANNITIDASSSLTVNAGGALTINGNLTQNGTLSVLSDASANGSLIANGTSEGNVTYKRYLSTSAIGTEGWHLIGAPVSGQSINTFSDLFLTSDVRKSITPYVNNVVSASRWNYYTTDGTNPITDAGNFADAKGYSAKLATNGTLDFIGTLNTVDKSISITDGGDDPTGNRWNLIANPYTAALKGGSSTNTINSFLKVNIDANNLDPYRAGLYLWNGSAPYVAKSLDDDFFIAPGQAFFVHAPDGGGTSASFTEAMQSHQTGNIFLKSSTSYPEVILNLTDGSTSSISKIRYISNRTTGLDVGSDLGTYTGLSEYFQVFTHLVSDSQGINLAIQALPISNYEKSIVPVGVNAKAGKEIIFSAETFNFPSDLKVFIEDREENSFTRIDGVNTAYKTVLSNTQNGIGRFYLHTSKSTLNTDNNLSLGKLRIYQPNPSTLRIVGLSRGHTSIRVSNILGKEITNVSFTGETGVKDIYFSKLTKGIYVVEIFNETGVLNKKMFLE